MRRTASPELILIAHRLGGRPDRRRGGERLQGEGIAVRCVSMPSWELFDAQPQAYRDAVLPPSVARAAGGRSGLAAGLAPLCRRSRRRARRRSFRRLGAGRRDAARIRLHRRRRLRARAGRCCDEGFSAMTHAFKVGDHVRWNSEAGHVSGHDHQGAYPRLRTTRVTRATAPSDDPQYEIRQRQHRPCRHTGQGRPPLRRIATSTRACVIPS